MENGYFFIIKSLIDQKLQQFQYFKPSDINFYMILWFYFSLFNIITAYLYCSSFFLLCPSSGSPILGYTNLNLSKNTNFYEPELEVRNIS